MSSRPTFRPQEGLRGPPAAPIAPAAGAVAPEPGPFPEVLEMPAAKGLQTPDLSVDLAFKTLQVVEFSGMLLN